MMLFGKIMRIFVMRHGQAQAMACSDQNRELTTHGQYDVECMASWLEQNNHCFDAIFVSPYIRAQQTARIVKNIVESSPELTTLKFITPEDSAKQMHDYIDGVFSDNPKAKVLIVSHMPLVSYLVSEFTNFEQAPLFQTAAIVEVDYDVSSMKGQLIGQTSPAKL